MSCEERLTLPARIPFKKIMDCLSANDVAQAHAICVEHKCRPKLGQLLVSGGKLSIDDLNSLLLVHESEELKNVPMGKMLVIGGCLTGEELRAYLTLQKMLRLPLDHHERYGQKLIELGLITPEQLRTALNDRLQKKITLRESVIARGYAAAQSLPPDHDGSEPEVEVL